MHNLGVEEADYRYLLSGDGTCPLFLVVQAKATYTFCTLCLTALIFLMSPAGLQGWET